MSTEATESKTRIIEVTMKFWKAFHVEVPEGVTEQDVLSCELVEDEARWSGDVSVEHDETSTRDEGHKSPEDVQRLKRHSKVFTWKEAQRE